VLWLHGNWPSAAGLQLFVPGFDLTTGLRALCTDVKTVDTALPWQVGDERFDVVTLYGRAPQSEEPLLIQRVLRPGGLALFGFNVRGWIGRWQTWLQTRRAKGAQHTAARFLAPGFSEAWPYCVEPSLSAPRSLVPIDGPAIAAFEAMRRDERGAGPARRLLQSGGLSALLYPAVVVVARK
jgi:hypothetical protein